MLVVVVRVVMVVVMVMTVMRVTEGMPLMMGMADRQVRLLVIVRFEQLLHAYFPVHGLGLRENVLDHLVLKDWRA